MTEQRAAQQITKGDVDSFKRDILEQTVLIRVETAAKIMDCSPKKVMRLVEDGRLRCYNESRQRGLRLKASELKEYVKSLEIPADEWLR